MFEGNRPRKPYRLCLSLALVGLLAACAGPQQVTAPGAARPAASGASVARPAPRIQVAEKPLQCVPYARARSGIELYGDAWSWWGAAEGTYQKGRNPQPGSVLVLSRNKHTKLGHLAVVAEIVSSREILVEHANWLNRGNIHLMTPVHDVSAANDWSAVRFWYTPGGHLGRRVYPANGFIHQS